MRKGNTNERLIMAALELFSVKGYDGTAVEEVAKYWHVKTGFAQSDTSVTTEMNLALALENYDSVDFAAFWDRQHVGAERTGSSTENFISWINECRS